VSVREDRLNSNDCAASKPDIPSAGAPHLQRPITSPAPGVAVWLCSLEPSPAEFDQFMRSLSSEERERANRFGTTTLRNRWIAGRGALRAVLGRTLDIDAATVPIRRGPRGRPGLAGDGDIDFNVSHTRGVALIGVACGLPAHTRVGVDIEHRDRAVGADRLARKFLTPREQASLADLTPDLRRQRFLRYWTCKEAMSKATGDGVAAPFRRLDVELAAAPRLVEGPPPYLPDRWTLHPADLPEEWLATIAIWRRAP
jgi:4'-phosphopantetheinyl transferase